MSYKIRNIIVRNFREIILFMTTCLTLTLFIYAYNFHTAKEQCEDVIRNFLTKYCTITDEELYLPISNEDEFKVLLTQNAFDEFIDKNILNYRLIIPIEEKFLVKVEDINLEKLKKSRDEVNYKAIFKLIRIDDEDSIIEKQVAYDFLLEKENRGWKLNEVKNIDSIGTEINLLGKQ